MRKNIITEKKSHTIFYLIITFFNILKKIKYFFGEEK